MRLIHLCCICGGRSLESFKKTAASPHLVSKDLSKKTDIKNESKIDNCTEIECVEVKEEVDNNATWGWFVTFLDCADTKKVE